MKNIAYEIMDAVDAIDGAADNEEENALEAGTDPDDADDQSDDEAPAVH
jgi:hypothetical protein